MPAGTSGKGQGTATKHAKRLVLQCNPETQQCINVALANRVNDSPAHLQCKLNGFLRHVVKENYPWLEGLQIKYEVIEDMVFEKMLDWLRNPRDNASYSHSDLMLHNKLWDIVNTDKDGAPKDHDFVDWCKRIAWIAATEHNDPFRILVEDICANDLTRSQRRKSKYKLWEDSSISTELRSLVNVILRKNLGDARVAGYILEHGVPTLLDPPWFRSTPPQTEIDNMLEEFLGWYASLLKWLSNLQNDPHMSVAQKLSDPNQKEWRAERRRRKANIEQQLRHGEMLAHLRDTRAKDVHNMSATQQRVLEDYDTGKLRKCLDEVRIRRPSQQAPRKVRTAKRKPNALRKAP